MSEVVVVVIIVAIIVALVLPMIHRSRCGVASLKDKTQLVMIHKGLIFDSGDHNGAYATPGLIQPIRVTGPDASAATQDYSLNHSAPLYSYMIMKQLVPPDMLVSSLECVEVNPGVSIKSNYNYNIYNPAANCFWDPTFVMRIDNPKIGANCSFAHAAICGLRRESEWRDTQSAGVACFGTRGTRNGATSGDDYTKSPTLRLHGPKNQWYGHVVFNDDHAETLGTFFSPVSLYDPDKSGNRVKDNMYAAEFPSPNGNQAAGDNFLGVFIGSTEFTVNDVYDPLDK